MPRTSSDTASFEYPEALLTELPFSLAASIPTLSVPVKATSINFSLSLLAITDAGYGIFAMITASAPAVSAFSSSTSRVF